MFLDDLWSEFEKTKNNINALTALHDKIAGLRFLDPACGSGNFLIITYKEIRRLELAIILQLQKLNLRIYGMEFLDVSLFAKVNVDKFFGIEYEEFPAQIAQVAMWLIDHQMNLQFGIETGKQLSRIPLVRSSTIVNGNALRIDWQSLLIKETTTSIHAEKANIILNEPPQPVYKTVNVYAKEAEFVKAEDIKPVTDVRFDYILGNPPFVGSKWMNDLQRADMEYVFGSNKSYGILDYVTAWYFKSSNYLKNNPSTQVAFVSTNSITQGEQVFPLWNCLFKEGVKISFAYRTFVWSNEARNRAAVHCVIIGLSKHELPNKKIFTEHDGIITETKANNINPYLIDAKDILVPNRSKPICNVPEIATGNKPIDDGNYIFSENEMKEFIEREPNSKKYILPFLGAEEFINNKTRYILYLKNASPEELRTMPNVLQRVQLVRSFREKSNSKPTQKLALTPTLFHTENFPTKNFLVIPQVSSVRRKYIPIGYLTPPVICSDKLRILPNATLYHFGTLTSIMHMTWMKTITGRLKSDFQYSVLNVYNNFPWPESPTEKQTKAVEDAAQAVLDARAQFPKSSLADLYDPNTMPPVLVKAHQQLDKAVDLCYRPQPFPNETKRIEFLFELYDKYTAGLFVKEKKKKNEKAKN